MRQMGGTAQFAYTSHPWLVNEYLYGHALVAVTFFFVVPPHTRGHTCTRTHTCRHGTAGCAHKPRTPQQVKELESAIAAGYVLWHGKPMNIFPELSDATTFDHGLALAQNLNAEFNTSWGVHLAKSTDVPGMHRVGDHGWFAPPDCFTSDACVCATRTGLSKSVIPLLAARGIGAVHMGYNGACLVPDLPR